MNRLRPLMPIVVCALAGAAQAQLNFSNINATYTLNPGSVGGTWNSFPNSTPMSIDFTGGAPAFKVGGSTTFDSGSSTITFDVTSAVAISGVDLVMQGNVQDFGRISYVESATGGAGSLGSITGSILGGSYTGGVNGAFTQTFHLQFSQAVTQFSITKSFRMDINNQSLPSTSVATLGLVEQNFYPVPEPATMAVLGMGALALIRRRRR